MQQRVGNNLLPGDFEAVVVERCRRVLNLNLLLLRFNPNLAAEFFERGIARMNF